MPIHNKLEPVSIEGEKYYTMEQFALLTGKSVQTIRNLACYSNPPLITSKKFLGKTLIPVNVLLTHKWKFAGRGSMYYTFNEKGEKIIHDDNNDDESNKTIQM